MTPPAIEVFYSADLDIDDWAARHDAGEVPDRWPYGLDQLPGAPTSHSRGPWRLRDRVLRKLDGRYDWTARAPARRPSLCWDERTGVPVALTRRAGPVVSGVIWLSDHRPGVRDVLTRRALHRCVAVFTSSSAQLEPLHREWGLPVERLHHVPLGIDERFFSVGDTPPVPESVLVVGNDRDRDHRLAVEAVGLAQQRRPGVRLTLASTQPITVSPALGRRLLGVPHADLVGLYRQAAVVVMATRPNLHISGLTSMLEAMACGRPVVATATPGMSDYVTDGVTGLLVAPGDATAVAEAVESLLAEPELAQRMGRAGRAAVEQHFTSSKMARRLAELIAV